MLEDATRCAGKAENGWNNYLSTITTGDNEMSEELKPCPCGRPTDALIITDAGQGGKYAMVAGNCCGEWMIEFRANYLNINSPECMALALAAWNDSPRSTCHTPEYKYATFEEWWNAVNSRAVFREAFNAARELKEK
jgi:hypothetical protein